MNSPQTKINLQPWQWALIGSGSTIILALAGFGLWNLVASKSPDNSATQSVEKSTIKRLLGQWQQKDLTRFIFTPEGKLFFISPHSNQAIESRYQLNDQTQPNQLTISDPSNHISKTVIFELTSDNQLRIDYSVSANSSEFSSNAQLLQKVSDVASLPLGIILEDNQALVKQANKAKQSEGKTYIGAINRGQQAFFLENNHFASNLDKLQLGIKSSTKDYTYSIVAIDDKRVVQNIGLAKTEGLKSYTGITFIKKDAATGETITFTKLCESIQPTREMPPQPQQSGEEMQCPAGYVSLNRN